MITPTSSRAITALIIFWCIRFAMALVMVGASLTLLHWLVRPSVGASTMAPWAVGASFLVATVSTYWAYRRGRTVRPPDQGS